MRTETLTERQALASGNYTVLNNTGMTTGNGLNMGILKKVRAFLHVGAVTTPTLVFQLKSSPTSGGSFAAITGLTVLPIITIVAAAANTWYTIEITSDLLGLPAGNAWVRAEVLETNSSNGACDLFMIGDESDYCPVMTVAGAAAQTPNLSTATFTTAIVAHV